MNRVDLLTLAAAAVLVATSGAVLITPPESKEQDLLPSVTPHESQPLQASALAPPSLPSERACPKLVVEPAPPLIAIPELDRPIPAIEQPEALAAFYASFARLLRGKRTSHLRIGYYADSNGTKDYITGELRRVLQERFGDAGHGYIAMVKPWDWYLPRDVRQGLDHHLWHPCVVSSHAAPDGLYGHTLIAAEASERGATTWVATANPGARVGCTVNEIGIHFLKRPEAGRFDVQIDDKLVDTVDARGPEIAAGHKVYRVPDAPHKVAIVAQGGRPVRLLGTTLERSGPPSVVIDTLAVGGASWRTMLRDDPKLYAQTLQDRGYELIVLHMGTNSWKGEKHRIETMRAMIGRIRAAVPETPVLVLSPPDHFEDGELMMELAQEQRAVARSMGVAYFDFHAAMGGYHSMQAFWRTKMCQNDLVHFNEPGGAYMAHRVLEALYREIAQAAQKTPSLGCDAEERAEHTSSLVTRTVTKKD